jgi:hypothetical protein
MLLHTKNGFEPNAFCVQHWGAKYTQGEKCTPHCSNPAAFPADFASPVLQVCTGLKIESGTSRARSKICCCDNRSLVNCTTGDEFLHETILCDRATDGL